MKNRLNLTIDPEIISKGKRLAAQQNKSLSELIEEMIKRVPEEEPRILKFLRENPPVGKNVTKAIRNKDLWAEYMEDNKKKYGL